MSLAPEPFGPLPQHWGWLGPWRLNQTGDMWCRLYYYPGYGISSRVIAVPSWQQEAWDYNAALPEGTLRP